MDNPWANAWGDDTRPHHSSSPTTSWSVPATSNNDHEEADIGIPSWSSNALQWNEPTTSLWGEKSNSEPTVINTDHDTHIELTAEPDVGLSTEDVPSLPDSPDSPQDSPVGSRELEIGVFTPPSLALPSFRDESTEDTRPESRPSSPDAFGTFETGLRMNNVEADPWTPSKPSFSDLSDLASTSWETNWAPADSSSDTERVDEWEAAKQEKARRDLHVPPELLASIIERFEQLSHDLWPDDPLPDSKDETKLQSVEDMQELSSVIEKFVPDNLTIPPHADFSKTFISKKMAETLKFTRHAPMVRLSPLARYAASKGSTAWEASVKARPELSQDDFVPAGWRVVPKEKDVAPPVIDTKQKSAGGLLSFFGRRSMTPPVADKPVSPVTKPSAGPSASPRPSLDTHRTSISSSSPVVSSPLSPTASAGLSSVLPLPPDREPTPPPPSAVSRFLTRFSRTKSSTTSPRNSIALSSNDLEFLSDIVPSASASNDVDSSSLSDVVESPPLPEKLPPPLAPPPKNHLPSGVPKPSTIFQDNPSPLLDISSLSPSRPLPAPLQTSSLMDTMMFVPSVPEPVKSSQSASSRNMTPVSKPMPSPTLRSTPGPFQPSKRIPTAIMSFNPTTQSAVSPSSFTIPPPPTSRQQTPVPSPPPAAPTVPIHNPVPRNATAQLSLFDDEEFSDFHTIPAYGNGAASSAYADASFSSFSSEQSLFSSANSNSPHNADGFDEFDDFVQPTLRTPSPPAVPAKTSARPAKITLASKLPVGSPPRLSAQLPPQKRKVNRSEHQRTLSLMESAAAHGKWPSPPSPLPPPLEPPPGGVKKSVQLDIFGGDESISSPMQQAQMNALGALTVSQSSPAILAPVPASGPLLRPPQNHVHMPFQTSNKTVSTKMGVLSAQDLSFFEGL